MAASWIAQLGSVMEPSMAAHGNVSAGSIRNLGEKESLDALAEEFKFNKTFVTRVRALKNEDGYIGWRRVRGDGNCAYRAVAYNYLEQIVSAPEHDRLRWGKSLLEKLRKASFPRASDQAAHTQLLHFVERLAKGSVSEEELFRTVQPSGSVIDEALVRAARNLTGMFMLQWSEAVEKNGAVGLSFTEMIGATNGVSVSEWVETDVEPEGIEAEGAALTALPQALGVGLRIAYMDPAMPAPKSGHKAVFFADISIQADPKGVDEQDRMEAGTPGGRALIHVQLRPGHYDINYPRPGPELLATEMGAVPMPATVLEPNAYCSRPGRPDGDKSSFGLEAFVSACTLRHFETAREIGLQWLGCW